MRMTFYEFSPEMKHFFKKGTCPHCGVFIMQGSPTPTSEEYWRDRLWRFESMLERIHPPDFDKRAKTIGRWDRDNTYQYDMQCMTCMKTWPASIELIDVASYQLIRVTGEQQTETFLSQETKQYSNQSSAKIKHRLSVTNTVSQTVTIEADKALMSSAQASVNIYGFANIQGQIQLQLSQRYSVAVQQTLSVNEEMEVDIPPFRTIEVVITWKTKWRKGNAVLGNGSLPTVEVPYWIPLRLSFDAVPRDVAPPRKGS